MERLFNPKGQWRMVFVHDRQCCTIQCSRHEAGAGIDCGRQGIHHKRHQDRVAQHAAEFLNAEMQYVGGSHQSTRLLFQQNHAKPEKQRRRQQQREEEDPKVGEAKSLGEDAAGDSEVIRGRIYSTD